MISLIFKNIIRAKSIKIGLVFLLGVGLLSLVVGKQFLDRQHKHTEELIKYQQEHFARTIQHNKEELGLLLYYLRFSFVNTVTPISGLSIGQRDINPSIQQMTIRGIEAQRYDSELTNPSNLLMGNLDFSFVLIYLFPLFIIALTYNIISEEKENGTWRIIVIQSENLMKYILQQFMVRFGMILCLLCLLLGIAIPFLGIPFDTTFLTFSLLSVLYLIFWFVLTFVVTAFQKSSNYNAVFLFASWILLLIIIPSSINNYLVKNYPTPEAFEMTLKQRKGYHEKWDMDKQKTMDAFYAHYPQFSKYSLPEKEFSWQWYYAMQQVGDDEAAPSTLALKEKLVTRNQLSTAIAQFIPSLHLQIQLNEIVHSGLTNQLLFLEAVSKQHEKLRLYFYPKIIENKTLDSVNWDEKSNIRFFEDLSSSNLWQLFLPITVIIVLLASLGMFLFSKKRMTVGY